MKHKKLIYISAIIFAAIFILCTIGSFILEYKVDQLAKDKGGIYYTDIDISILGRSVDLENFNLWSPASTDTIIKAESISMSDLSWWNLVINKKLKCNTITLNSALIDHSSYPVKKKKVINTIKAMSIDAIVIQNTNINYVDKNRNSLQVDNLNLKIEDIEITDSITLNTCHANEISFSVDAFNYIPYNKNYFYKTGSVDYNGDKSTLIIDDLNIAPQYTDVEWKTINPYKPSSLDWKVKKLNLDDIDIIKSIKNKSLDIESLTIDQGKLIVNIMKPSISCTDCYKPFIHQQLRELDIPVSVPAVSIKNSKVTLDIDGKNSQPLTVTFDEISGNMYNISNIPEKLQIAPKATANLNALFMNETPMDVDFSFDLDSDLYGYSYDASIKGMNMTYLNNIFDQSQPVAIENGKLQTLNFSVNGDNSKATGTMDLDYTGLKLVVLKNNGNKKKLATMILRLITKKDSDGHVTGNMESERINSKGIFHQWWITIIDGFKSTILE